MMTLEVSMAKGAMLAVLLILLGRGVKKKITFLQKFCIPEGVVGGLIFAILALILKQLNIVMFEFDNTLEKFFMNIFFTASGFAAGRGLLKKGKNKVIIFIILAAIMAFLQNFVAIILSNVMGLDPRIGLMTGSIPMTGGHGNAAAFGPTVEAAGATGALSVAIASATFGLVAGSIIGGPIGNFLIKKNNLSTEKEYTQEKLEKQSTNINANKAIDKLDPEKSMIAVFMVLIAWGIGAYLADIFKIILPNITLPIHVMGMIGGAIVRNIVDSIKEDAVPLPQIDIIGDISLSLFVVMAIMAMKLWDLISLAGPLLVLLLAQVILMILFAVLITFNVMGRDYDAAVMTAGHIGFGMGAVPVSMANMNTLCDKYEYSELAFFVVPIVGGMFSNFTNAGIITGFFNYLGI